MSENREKPSFLLQGNGAVANRGCEAILRATADLLRKEFGPCRLINCPAQPLIPQGYVESDPDIIHQIPKPYKIFTPDWFARQFRKRILGQSGEPFERHVPRCLATLTLGGDNYTFDYWHPKEYFDYNEVTLRHGKPLVLWGASIGPFSRDPAFERWAAEQLKRVTLICARESETVDYLDSIGVRDNVRAVADPAFTLKPEEPALNKTERRILDQPHLGLNLSPLMRKYFKDGDWTAMARQCTRTLLEATDLPIALIPHVIFPGSDDHAFLREMREGLPEHHDRLLLVGPNYNARQYKWIIARLAAFIGARTHATIAAFSSGVPTLSLGYSMKARGINNDIFGNLDWLVPIEGVSGRGLAERAQKLLAAAPRVREHLTACMPDFQRKAALATEYLREAIETRTGK